MKSYNNSNVIETDGIQLETLIPEPVIHIPIYGEETPVQFGVRITNQTLTAYRFELPRFLPEFLDSRRRLIKVTGLNSNHRRPAEQSDIPLLIPGESWEFLLNATFIWYSRNCLKLSGYAFYGGIWALYNFQPGKYQVRLSYKNQLAKQKIFLWSARTEIDEFWTGEIATPFVKVRLR